MKKDMTQGNIYLSLLFFTLPVLCSNLLQQLYNVLDSIIVGRVCGDLALAAVGACISDQYDSCHDIDGLDNRNEHSDIQKLWTERTAMPGAETGRQGYNKEQDDTRRE